MARRRPRRAGRRRGVHDAGDALDHHQRLPAARARPGDRHLGAALALAIGPSRRLPRPRTSAGGRSSSSTSPSPPSRSSSPCSPPRVARRDGRPRGRHAGHGHADRRRWARSSWRWSRATRGAGARRASSACSRSRWSGSLRSSMIERSRVRRWSTSRSSARGRFLGANVVAFIVSFAMFAMFFFLALYMQNILGYSPLRGGRALPALHADDHVVARAPGAWPTSRPAPADRQRPVAGHDRAAPGRRGSTSTPSFGFLVVAFILMGIGMGFAMSPMSTAAMNAVDPARRRAWRRASLIMTRMVGGDLRRRRARRAGGQLGRTRPRGQLRPARAQGAARSSSSTRSAPAASGRGLPPPCPARRPRQRVIHALSTGCTCRPEWRRCSGCCWRGYWLAPRPTTGCRPSEPTEVAPAKGRPPSRSLTP